MRRVSIALLLTFFFQLYVLAQSSLPAHPLMVAYDEEKDITRDAYRESPYYMEIGGSWRQRHTDSSVVYTKQIDVERTWKDYRVFLNLRCGKACRVYLGNKFVGYGDDSRHWNEFLLNPYLKYGKVNTLTVEALKRADGALLEEPDIAVGLNGEPYILFKNDPNVSDLTLIADYDAGLASGTLTIDATLFNGSRKGRYYLEIEVIDPQGRQLDRMGRWVIFDKKSEERTDISRTWPGVIPWSAEQPSLYTAIVRLRNDKMDVEEVVGSRFGFRRVEVRDGLFLINGKPVTLRGVTYGSEHTEGNISRQRMEKAVLDMKKNGINAVRTTRFSPMDDWFYSLCDSYGLYVVADANLMPASTGRRAVATEQDKVTLFEQRVEHLYGRYRNHASIIAWSLGNTRDNGLCMTAAYKRLKVLEKNRPVVFSGAQAGESTDIVFLDYPTAEELRKASEKGDRPVMMARSVDAPHFADLGNLWRVVDNNRSVQGGFVDAWPLSSDMLDDIRNLYAPFRISLIRMAGGEGEFRVSNNCDFADFSRYRLDYTIYTNLRANIISGELPLAIKAGESDKVSMRVPKLDLRPGEEPYIRFDISRRPEGRKPAAPVSLTVFPIEMKTHTSPLYINYGGPLECVADTLGVLHISSAMMRAIYDKGLLNVFSSKESRPIACPQLAFEGDGWERHLVAYNNRMIDEGTLCIDAMVRYLSKDGHILCDVRETYAIYSSGDITVDYTLRRVEGNHTQIKADVVSLCWRDNQMLEWYGSPRETLIEGGDWHVTGVNKKKTDDILYAEEIGDVRWCLLMDTLAGMGAMARLDNAPFAIKQTSAGLTLEQREKDGKDMNIRLIVKLWNQSMDSVVMLSEASVQKYPKVSSGIPEPPTIKADASRFAQPLKVTLSAAGGDIRYTIDGSEPTETSTLYREPFYIATSTIVKARVYEQGLPPSFTSSRQFNFDYIRSMSFSRRPNTPYNIGTDTILFDGRQGTIGDMSHGWLGFSGTDVQTTVELAKPVSVEKVALRFAHNPVTWAFAPQEVVLTFIGTDGTEDTVKMILPFDPKEEAQKEPRVVDIMVAAPQKSDVVSIRIDAHTIGSIPAWHRGKGLKPWLLMDEIEVHERLDG